MGLLSDLSNGTLGVRLSLASWRLLDEDERSARLVHDASATEWWVFFDSGLHLDLDDSQLPALRTNIERHCRFLFEQVFATQPATGNPPRTADLKWSPMVSVERRVIGEAPALEVLHRVLYQPGNEVVMGHLLVPLMGGLLEVRWVARELGMTGLRESMLGALMMQKKGEMGFLSQAEMDDPVHDEKFAQHPISRARAAARLVLETTGIEISDPDDVAAGCEIELEELGCTFTPPPGFVHEQSTPGHEGFRRATFSVTDGIEWLELHRMNAGVGSLSAEVERMAKQTYVDAGVKEIVCHPARTTSDGYVAVTVEGIGHLGPLRMSMCAFRDQRGGWALLNATTSAQPREVLEGELEEAARSLRARPQ
jgi:hypothetical protein